jgi:hypothetical protein
MRSLLSQLDSNEALLLMYLADELPQQDRVQVARMLEQDEELRAQMETMRALMQNEERDLAGAARVDDISAERAIRNTITAMRARTAETHQEGDAVQQEEGWRMPGWAYPVAAAAILLIAFSVYLENMDPTQVQTAKVPPIPYLDAPPLVDPVPGDAVTEGALADDLAETFDDSDWVLTEASDPGGLNGAMEQLRAIERLSVDPARTDSVQ